MIAKAKQLKLAAEEKVAAQELYETMILLEVIKRRDDFTSLDLKITINVAQATWDTLIAKEHLAVSKVQKCKTILTGLCDAITKVYTHVENANLQVERVFSIMNSHRIHIILSMKLYLPLFSEHNLLTIHHFQLIPITHLPHCHISLIVLFCIWVYEQFSNRQQ